jgi:hypothetical protein
MVSFQGWGARREAQPGHPQGFVRPLGVARQRVYIGGGCVELGGLTPPQKVGAHVPALPGSRTSPDRYASLCEAFQRGSVRSPAQLRGEGVPGGGGRLRRLGVVPSSTRACSKPRTLLRRNKPAHAREAGGLLAMPVLVRACAWRGQCVVSQSSTRTTSLGGGVAWVSALHGRSSEPRPVYGGTRGNAAHARPRRPEEVAQRDSPEWEEASSTLSGPTEETLHSCGFVGAGE